MTSTTHEERVEPAVIDEPQATAPSSGTGSRSVRHFIAAYAFVGLFIAIIVVFSLHSRSGPTFFTTGNLRAILATQSVLIMVAVGMLIPMTAGYFDLSAAAIAAVSAITVAQMFADADANLGIAIALGLVVSAVIGLITGILVARVGASSFVTTLAMSTLLAGGLSWKTRSLPVSADFPPWFDTFGTGRIIGLPWLLVVVIPVVALTIYLLGSTPFGRYLHAIGSNPRAARLVGIPVRRTVLISFVLSGLLGGVGGVLLTAQSGGADPGAGGTFLFPAFTALFLGMTTIKPGKPNVPGTILAVLFLATAVSGLSMAGADAWVGPVFQGSALVVSVCVATVFSRGSGRTEAAL
ncbi:MAG: ABC transporter permease [Ilumatobacteraceae bacterium]